VLNVTEYDFSEYGPAEGRLMDEVNPGGVATFEGNMSAFRDRGGKFISYHGRADPVGAISSPYTGTIPAFQQR
jgi:feruloyl esterase